jgi:hypothetical protein
VSTAKRKRSSPAPATEQITAIVAAGEQDPEQVPCPGQRVFGSRRQEDPGSAGAAFYCAGLTAIFIPS